MRAFKGLVFLSFCIGLAPEVLSARFFVDGLAAKVDNETITYSEVKLKNQIETVLTKNVTSLSSSLEALVFEKTALRFASKERLVFMKGFGVSPKKVDALCEKLPTDLLSSENRRTVRRLLRDRLRSSWVLRQMAQKGMTVAKYLAILKEKGLVQTFHSPLLAKSDAATTRKAT